MFRHCASMCATLLVAIACAPIQHNVTINQPLNRTITAGPGDLIAHAVRQRNLQNAFGASDVFGRMTDEGFSDLYFQGVETDGTIVFYRRNVTIQTNETTMSRTPITQTFGSASGTATTFGNTTNINASGVSTTINPQSDYHIAVPQDALAIRLPPKTPSLLFEGHIILIQNASAGALTYQLTAPAATPAK